MTKIKFLLGSIAVVTAIIVSTVVITEPDSGDVQSDPSATIPSTPSQRNIGSMGGRLSPQNAAKELEFVHQLAAASAGQSLTADADWTARGPWNLGGRTKALAIDVTDEDILLAGSTSSGMFKSTDGGASWTKTTAPNQLHSVTSIAQNESPENENIWYYGTGDRAPNGLNSSADGAQWAHYRGNGIFKSIDGGDSWQLLESTVSDSPHQTEGFDFVYRLVTFGENGIAAATSTGLYISSDGGTSWNRHFEFDDEGFPPSPSIEVALAFDGSLYATVAGDGPEHGIYRSVDGDTWNEITPDDWPASTVRTVMGVSESNPDAVYFFTEVASLQKQLRKHDVGSGWTDLTSGLPFDAQIATFGGILMVLEVKPDDENTLFLGAIDLFRSTDGGENFELISGTGPNFHVDQTSIAFYPSDPDRMIVGNDGGLYRTDDNMAETTNQSLDWESLNNGYLTTQFYTVAIDHGSLGNEMLLGGTQDHGTVLTTSSDPVEPWDVLLGGDGAFNAIVDGGETLYQASAATFRLNRFSLIDGQWRSTEITPVGGRLGLWLTFFQLDPHDQKVMYLASQRTLWRNSDLTEIPEGAGAGQTDVNWDTLANVGDYYFTAFGMSEATPRRLYYAGFDRSRFSRLFFLENPHEGQPTPVDITGDNFPVTVSAPIIPRISCIAVDPRDPDKLIVVFPAYSVLSIFASDDGGASWTAVSGNLEENPDGSGSGPSVRWVSTLYIDDQPVYLAGTSVGLFSTAALDGMNTKWIPEAQSTIGNVVIDMLDVRQSDGFVATATHGNGVYTTYITQVPTSTEQKELPGASPEVVSAYPNPFRTATTVEFRLAEPGQVSAAVYDVNGRQIETLFEGQRAAGELKLNWQPRGLSAGVYSIRLSAGATERVARVVLSE